jgi:Leucine-rich repeat (LRR) protein
LEYLDLSGNIGISEIPESLNQLPSLKTLILKGCKIKKFSEEVSHFFWMGENYRYYANYTLDDVRYYESTHRGRAIFNNKLYKNFVKWLFKMRLLMKEFNFNYLHIERFERKTSKNAINSGRLTNSFKKWLDDRYQTRITSFF